MGHSFSYAVFQKHMYLVVKERAFFLSTTTTFPRGNLPYDMLHQPLFKHIYMFNYVFMRHFCFVFSFPYHHSTRVCDIAFSLVCPLPRHPMFWSTLFLYHLSLHHPHPAKDHPLNHRLSLSFHLTFL